MKKIWVVAVQEYRKHVLSRRFLLALLSVPLVIIVMVGVILLVMSMQFKGGTIGYVDQAGILDPTVKGPEVTWPEKPVQMLAFTNEQAAVQALNEGEIGAYYILPKDYLETGEINIVHMGALNDSARTQFYDFIGANLLKNTDPAVAARLVKGADITVESPDGSRSLSGDDWFSFLLPMIAGIGFLIAMLTSAGYLMQAVVEEKENRTMEVMITSMTPNQLMAGKIIGDTSVGLTQLLAWILFIAVPFLAIKGYFPVLQSIHVAGSTVAVMVLVMLPAFLLVCALMATIGSTISELREGQQMTGLIAMPTWAPYLLTSMLMSNPNSPLAVLFSFLPLTAPVTMIVRDGLTILPPWQIGVSALLQILYAAGAVWLAGRAFRLGMLRYGKHLSLREIFSRAG